MELWNRAVREKASKKAAERAAVAAPPAPTAPSDRPHTNEVFGNPGYKSNPMNHDNYFDAGGSWAAKGWGSAADQEKAKKAQAAYRTPMQEEAMRAQRGRASTILTGGLGDTSQVKTARRTLMGF